MLFSKSSALVFSAPTVALTLVAGSLGMLTLPGAPAARAETPSPTYVAMGDSFSAGEGLDTYTSTNECDRSTLGYPEVLSRTTTRFLPSIDFVACSGAVIRDAFEPNRSNPGEPAQLDAVTQATRVVTLTMGGNDVGFVDVVRDCTWGGSGWTLLDSKVPGKPGCKGRQENAVTNAIKKLGSNRTDVKTSYAALIDQIHRRASLATIYIAGYPKLFGSTVTTSGRQTKGCQVGSAYPWISQLNGWFEIPLFVSKTDTEWLNKSVDTLNSTIKGAVDSARGHGVRVEYVPADSFDEHAVCGKKSPWVNGASFDPSNHQLEPVPLKESFHPTISGQQSYANLMRKRIESTAPQEAFTLTISKRLGDAIDVILGGSSVRSVRILIGGKVPSGLHLNRKTSRLYGTPLNVGATNFVVEVENQIEGLWRIEVTINVSPNQEDPAPGYKSTTGLDGEAGLMMSCPAPTSCLLAQPNGTYSRFDGTSWTPRQLSPISPATYQANQDGNGFACPTVDRCFAVVSSEGVYESRDQGTSWTLTYPSRGLTVVSCATKDFCRATGSEAASFNGVSWSEEPSAAPPVQLYSLSCVSENFCVGGAEQANLVYADGVWSTYSLPGSEINIHIACNSRAFCVSGSRGGQYTVWNGNTWTKLSQSGNYISGLSCTLTYCMGFEWLTSKYTLIRPDGDNQTGTFANPQAFDNPGDTLACVPVEFGSCFVAFRSGDVSIWDGSRWTVMAGEVDGTYIPPGWGGSGVPDHAHR